MTDNIETGERKGAAMTAVPSGAFLNEFSLYADRACDARETFIIQRESAAPLVMMSLASYNALQKQLYLAKTQSGGASDAR